VGLAAAAGDLVSARQWCAECAKSPAPVYGGWVEVEGHEHPLPVPRATVYLYEPEHDGRPEKWAAYLPLWLESPHETSHDSIWLGWKILPSLPEAMEYARGLSIGEHERRTLDALLADGEPTA
jgi:hypothetical protein